MNLTPLPFKPIPLQPEPVKEGSFWDKYKMIIIGIIIGAVVLIFLIFGIYFIQRRNNNNI